LHDIRELPSRGEYRLNCLAKPKFILSVLEEKKKPFVWMDVDSLIHAELDIFDKLAEDVDMAFAYQGLFPHIDYSQPKASPILFTYKDIVLEFLKYWIDMCEENEKSDKQLKVFDHEILMYKVIPLFFPKMKVAALGINYAIWPGTSIPPEMKPMITMGIADGSSKEKSLREMGLQENLVKFNLVGNI
jgi:hypothetical protein